MKSIILGGGCFWCLEAFYQQINGVRSVTPGYAGGTTANPSYDSVSRGIGNYAEVVRVVYDEVVVTLLDLLTVFFAMHDPTTPNRQGNDVGVQYRSCIYYDDPADQSVIESALQNAQQLWDNPIVTEIRSGQGFHEAEAYHHNYFQNNPTKAYCQVIINPKLSKLRDLFQDLIK